MVLGYAEFNTIMRVDDVADQLLQLGQGALMAKVDIKGAYCMVPVHPQNCYLIVGEAVGGPSVC